MPLPPVVREGGIPYERGTTSSPGLFLEKMVFPPHPFLKEKALGTKLKGARMLVVSLRGVNFGFWSHLGCSGQTAIIFSGKGLF